MTSLLSAALAAFLLQAATPPAPRTPDPGGDVKGTAVVRGRVMAADTSRPLRRARVSISGTGLTSARSTSTNSRGEYEIKDLPAGRLTVAVSRSGYMPMSLGQRTPDDLPRPLTLADGQVVDKLDFLLPRTGIVSGRVVDETGEAVGDVTIYLLRNEFFQGRRRAVPVANQVRTDDTGRYRVINVPPGEFMVMATLRETWVAGPKREVFAYAPSFFPSVASAREAARVKVALGQETPNVDITLVPSRAATLSGTATAADGSPMAGGMISLSVQMRGATWGMASTQGTAPISADGTWQLRDVPPGEYQLEASSSSRAGAPERAEMTVVVQGADLGNLALIGDPGGVVTGTVVADGGRALPAVNSPMRVLSSNLAPSGTTFGGPLSPDNGRVEADGRFTTEGVRGPSALRVSGLPRGWDIERIEIDGREVEGPLEVAGGQSLAVTIVISNRLPSVQGNITDAKGAFVEGVALLFPTDADKWVDGSAIRTARPDQTGSFRFEAIRPGEYLVVGLRSVARWQAADPEFLEGLRTEATTVRLRTGENEQMSLRVK